VKPRRMLRIWRAQARNALTIQFQYRVSLFIWMIGLVLNPLVFLVVWTTVARATGGAVSGYTAHDFAAYYIMLMIVDHITFTWVIFNAEFRIREGGFSPLLLRPVHPINADMMENAGFKVLMLIVIVPAAVVMGLVFGPNIHPAPWAVVAFVPALALAAVLRFTVEWTISLISFWISRMSAIDQIYFVLIEFLSGQIAPIALLPAPLRVLADVLPFQWMIAFPVQLILGRESPQQTAVGFGVLIVWLLIAVPMLRLVWRRGVRQYSAVGA
jgi:ABC-2 type transport system permease protein